MHHNDSSRPTPGGPGVYDITLFPTTVKFYNLAFRLRGTHKYTSLGGPGVYDISLFPTTAKFYNLAFRSRGTHKYTSLGGPGVDI